MPARILTVEETRRYREGIKEARNPFKPYENAGWAVESHDNTLFFFNNEKEQYVESSYQGRLISADGVDKEYANAMIRAYMPQFKLAKSALYIPGRKPEQKQKEETEQKPSQQAEQEEEREI